MAADPNRSPGSYAFTDRSVMRPWVTRMWFARIFPLLPPWLAANLVTLFSTGFLASVFFGAVFADRLGATNFALIQLVAIQVYVAGDHLDGMQATATATTSPLGDFLDHHCDLWAALVLVFGFWHLIAPAPVWMLMLHVLLVLMGFAITYVERSERRHLHFTSWGTLELIAIASVFYASWLVPGVRAWWRAPLWAGVPRTALVYWVGAAIAAGVTIVIARRLRRIPLPCVVAVAQWVALSAWCLRTGLPPLASWVLVSLIAAEYVARVMRAVGVQGSRPWPDLFGVLLVGALWLWPEGAGRVPLAWAIGIWAAVRYALTLLRIVGGWREHWVWRNSAGLALDRAPRKAG